MGLDRDLPLLFCCYFFFFPFFSSSLACIMKRNKSVGCYLASLPCNRKNTFPVYTIGLRRFTYTGKRIVERGGIYFPEIFFWGKGGGREGRGEGKDEFKLEIDTDIDRFVQRNII